VAQGTQGLVTGDLLNHVQGHPAAHGIGGQRTAEAMGRDPLQPRAN
jgi:hypothetical protein